jgi:Domain of unknown function (DUF6265)
MYQMRIFILLSLVVNCFASFSQDILRLPADGKPGKGTLKQIEWLSGYWKGTGLGGDCEELWMPANDNGLHGVFRFSEKGKLQFTEYMVIEEKEGSLKVRIKHFGAGVNPWEEKEKWVEFPLVKIEDQTAWFNGLTYIRKGDELVVKLAMKSEGKSYVEEFIFRKSVL